MTHRTLLRIMAGFCVGLALICMALALAYERKSAEAECYADAAELGLTPGSECERPR